MDVGLSLGISQREPILNNVEVVKHAEALGFDPLEFESTGGSVPVDSG